MKKREDLEVVSAGNNWTLGSLMSHIVRINPRTVIIFDHETEAEFILQTSSLNSLLKDFEMDDKITFRLASKESNGRAYNIMDVMHF